MRADNNWDAIAGVVLASSGPRVKRKKVLVTQKALKTCVDYFRTWMATGSSDLQNLMKVQHEVELKRYRTAQTASASRQKYFTKMKAVLPGMSDQDRELVRQTSQSHSVRKRILQTTMMRNPDWSPLVEVSGNTQRDIANIAARPVIYWIDNTIYAELIARIALHQSRIKAMHYSDHVHENGGIWLARKLVQKPVFRLEQRFLDQRILSRPNTHFASMRLFAQAMRTNKAMLSMNNAFLGRRHTCTPISNELHFVQATAPLNMARKYNALIVPVTAVETRAFEHYWVHFHDPLEADMSLTRDDDLRRMAQLSTARQLPLIRNDPDQWLCFLGDQIDVPHNGRIKRYGM